MIEYKNLIKGADNKKWINVFSKYYARIAQGRKKDDTKGTNTLFFIHPKQLPKKNKPNYLRICANFWIQK